MPPTLKQVFTYRAFLVKDETAPVGPIRGGASRVVAPVTGGFITGSGVEAKVLSGGADWTLLDPATGTAHLDARVQARTSDGEHIYIRYPGIIKIDSTLEKAFAWDPQARTTKSDDHYWISTPIFEVSSEKLKWMEQSVFVAHGHIYAPGDGTQAVEYEVYKVVSA